MSRRTINFDPAEARRDEYVKLEDTGEMQAALWDALEHLKNQGVDIGVPAQAMLGKRQKIKDKFPKDAAVKKR